MTLPTHKKPKIKILFLAANPEDRTGLELGREYRRIRDALRRGEYRDSFRLLPPELSARIEDLTAALTVHRPHVVHFCGHGSSGRGIAFEREDGYSRPADRQELTTLFETLNRGARLVFLNACHTKEQAEELSRIFDYNIGTNGLIPDSEAAKFADYFYRALADGATVEGAFRSAHAAIDGRLSGVSDLSKRKGVDDSKPFIYQVLGRRAVGPPHGTETPRKKPSQPSSSVANATVTEGSTVGTLIQVPGGNVNYRSSSSSRKDGSRKRGK